MGSDLGRIGENGANEFFETIVHATAYNEARDMIKGFTKDVDNEIVEDALQSMLSLITTSLIFKLLKYQEEYIERIFKIAGGLVTMLLASGMGKNVLGKMKKIKGIKLFKKLSMFQTNFSDRVATAQLVVDSAGNIMKAETTTQNETNPFTAVNQIKEHKVSKEKLNHQVGNSMVSRYNDTLLFKMFTKNFTQNDKTMIKKMLGKENSTVDIDIDDMNKIGDFLFVSDSGGNVTGLSDAFMQMVNSMGYTHNK